MTAATLAPRAFDDFYAAFYPRVRGLAKTMYGPADADDLAQETMARALAAYDRVDPRRDPWPWLVAIMRNIACDRLRSERSAPDAGHTVGVEPMTPYDAAVAAEERRLVRRALARLSMADRRLLVLREWHELSLREMAALVGVEPGTLRQQVFRARRRFAREFTDLGGRALGVAAVTGRGWRSRLGDAAAATPYGTQLAAAVTTVVATAGLLAGPGAPGPSTDTRAGRAGIRAAAAPAHADATSKTGAVAAGARNVRAGRVAVTPPHTAPAGPSDPAGPAPSAPALGTRHNGAYATAPVGDRRVHVADRTGRDSSGAATCAVPPVGCG
jgi:RNA polymerase sigma factor (sigma-70 family)